MTSHAPDETQWTSGAIGLLPLLNKLRLDGAAGELVGVPRLQSFCLIVRTPVELGRSLLDMKVESGWAAVHSAADGSRIERLPTVLRQGSGILSAEAVTADGLFVRAGPHPTGGLAVHAFGEDLAGQRRQGASNLPDIHDLLRQTRSFETVSRDVGRMVYDVYWQATRDFGLRPRLSLFVGFLEPESDR